MQTYAVHSSKHQARDTVECIAIHVVCTFLAILGIQTTPTKLHADIVSALKGLQNMKAFHGQTGKAELQICQRCNRQLGFECIRHKVRLLLWLLHIFLMQAIVTLRPKEEKVPLLPVRGRRSYLHPLLAVSALNAIGQT